MIKIMKHIKANLQPVTVKSLLDKGPVISGYQGVIAARCFTSILSKYSIFYFTKYFYFELMTKI